MKQIRVPLLTSENRKQFFWPAAFYIYLSYTFTGTYALFEPWHPPQTALDDWIPFLPNTIWIYLSHIAVMFSGWWWMVRGAECTRAFVAMVMVAVLATFYFLFFPTELPRRELMHIDAGPLTQAAWAFLMRADNPTNSFPSMHIAEATITAVALMRAHVRFRWLAPIWAAAVAVSTMTTEQHVALDVLGGLLLAAFCLWVTDRFIYVGNELPAEERDETSGNNFSRG